MAVERVAERLSCAASALSAASIPYAVVGGNAVFLWMTQHGEGGERFTPNADFLIDRADVAIVTAALEAAGFARDPERQDLFRDGPDGSPRSRLRLVFSGETVRETDMTANPHVICSAHVGSYQVLDLPALVVMKLTAHRTVDRVHLRDMLDAGLIDQTWTSRYPPELAERLQLLVDDPDGWQKLPGEFGSVIWHTVRSMGFTAAHQPRFRVFCSLMAAFWTGMILLGTVRLASASLPKSHTPQTTTATPAAIQCPMCAAMAHAGMKSGLKCCCCHTGGMTTASCACACRPQPQSATLAVLVWSPLAVLPASKAAPVPAVLPYLYSAHSLRLDTIFLTPLPRPPRLL